MSRKEILKEFDDEIWEKNCKPLETIGQAKRRWLESKLKTLEQNHKVSISEVAGTIINKALKEIKNQIYGNR